MKEILFSQHAETLIFSEEAHADEAVRIIHEHEHGRGCWTTEAPKQEGWYWLRNITAGSGPDDFEPVFFDAGTGLFEASRYCNTEEPPSELRKMAFEWWSEPIKEPK